MRLMLRLAIIVVACGVLASVAGAAAAPRSLIAPAPVSAVAFDGSRVAFAVGFSAGDCDRVRLWNLSTASVSKLGRSTSCTRTSTGTGIAALAVAGNRAVWLHYTGGNIREWSLWTASGSKPAPPTRLRFVARDVDAPPPIVLGDGDGDLLPYAVDRTVVVLRASGARRFAWTAPARVVALDARDGRVAVAQAGGLVTVLDAGGRVIGEESFGGEISAVEVSSTGVLAQVRGLVELHGAGGASRTFAIGSASRLQDASASLAVYILRDSVTTLSLSGGARRAVGVGTAAALEGARVAVAAGRRVLVVSL
jgi:hypothetical protein